MRFRAKHGRSEADAPFARTKREGFRRGPSIEVEIYGHWCEEAFFFSSLGYG